MATPLVLHVGLHKTGTTSIQAALGAARDDLRAARIVYPDPRPTLGGVVDYHFAFAKAVAEGDDAAAEAFVQQVAGESRRARAVILSAESMSRYRLGSGGFRPGNTAYHKRMRELLRGFKVTPLVMLRRQDAWVESMYSELATKAAGTNAKVGFERFRDRLAARLDYGATVERLRAVYGTVTVGRFEEAVASGNLVGHFFQLAGLGKFAARVGATETRRSPDARLVLWFVENPLGSWRSRMRFAASDAAAALFDDYGVPTLWPSESERAEFAARFTGDYGAETFPEPKPYTYRAVLTPADSERIRAGWKAWREAEKAAATA